MFKCYKIGIRGKLLKWIDNFIKARSFTVKIGNSFSVDKEIKTGVAQGSVLGPLLFIIYINDIVQVIPKEVSIRLYADDLKIFMPHRDNISQPRLQDAINAIYDWCNMWALSIANDKCESITISKNLNTLTILTQSLLIRLMQLKTWEFLLIIN